MGGLFVLRNTRQLDYRNEGKEYTMSDIVERLREGARLLDVDDHPESKTYPESFMLEEAAREIESLYEMVDKARGSLGYTDLGQITEWFDYFFPPKPKFNNVSCSQCGQEFGPGNGGFSHCEDHT